MFIIKWVELNDIYNYFPATAFAETFETALVKQYVIDERNEQQANRAEELFSGKIMSEAIIEEIRLK